VCTVIITVYCVHGHCHCLLLVLQSLYHPNNLGNTDVDRLKNNVIRQLTLELGKLIEEISLMLSGPRIQVAQLRYGSTAGFREMTGIPSIIVPQ